MNYALRQITTIILIFIISFFYISCTKNKNERSVWYINGEKYTSREMKAGVIFEPFLNDYRSYLTYSGSQHQHSMDIGLQFRLNLLPKQGVYPIKTGVLKSLRDTGVCIFYLTYDDKYYVVNPGEDKKVVVSSYKGLGKYQIPAVWMKACDVLPDTTIIYQNDSLLFSGVFYEPVEE